MPFVHKYYVNGFLRKSAFETSSQLGGLEIAPYLLLVKPQNILFQLDYTG